MPRARTTNIDAQTAVAPQDQGRGCLFSFAMVPPLAVVIISTLLASFALKTTPLESPAPSNISPIFTAEVQYWSDSIAQWAAASQLDPNLAATVMQIESCGDPRAISSAGAIGLFQVMPFHFYVTDNPYNPETNAARGLAYLARSLEAARGDARLALAGYNGGIGMIGRIGWPAETKRYVQYGLPIYEDARSGASASSAVEEWYSKFGASLCRRAHQRLGLP